MLLQTQIKSVGPGLYYWIFIWHTSMQLASYMELIVTQCVSRTLL